MTQQPTPWHTEQWFTSPWNHDPEATQQLRFPERIRIHDSTLRDGEQTPGVSFTREEKMDIASWLDRIGIDVIEAAFPAVSPYEKQCVAAIASQGLDARICGFARARQGDVDAAIECGVDMVSLFIATSDLHGRGTEPGHPRRREPRP